MNKKEQEYVERLECFKKRLEELDWTFKKSIQINKEILKEWGESNSRWRNISFFTLAAGVFAGISLGLAIALK